MSTKQAETHSKLTKKQLNNVEQHLLYLTDTLDADNNISVLNAISNYATLYMIQNKLMDANNIKGLSMLGYCIEIIEYIALSREKDKKTIPTPKM